MESQARDNVTFATLLMEYADAIALCKIQLFLAERIETEFAISFTVFFYYHFSLDCFLIYDSHKTVPKKKFVDFIFRRKSLNVY